MFHALHGDGGVEVGEFLVGLTDAVSFGFGGVFDVGHAPGRVAHQLEGRAALTLFVAFNGTEYKKLWIEYADIMKGGELKFLMGDEPVVWY